MPDYTGLVAACAQATAEQFGSPTGKSRSN